MSEENLSASQILEIFHFRVFDEDIVIVGAKGEGKSTLASKIVSSIPAGVTIIIWDFSNRFGNYGFVIRDNFEQILKMQGCVIVIQPSDKTKGNYLKFCKFVFDNLWNVVIVHDEVHQYVTKQSIDFEVYQLVLSGRNKGISNIFISTGTTSIPNYMIKNCAHFFALIHYLASDVKWLAENVGAECWQLLPQDKRRQVNAARPYWDLPTLPKHSFVYRDMHKPNGVVVSSL